jgi:TRAP-type C4-dicarboxylate transport system permease small subunit
MMLQAFDQRSDALEVPMWIAQSSAPMGLALILFMFLLRAYVSIGHISEDANAGQGPVA